MTLALVLELARRFFQLSIELSAWASALLPRW